MATKVFQWASGGVGRHTTRIALERETLELVGMHVHSPDKVGQDAGVLIGGEPVGVMATNDIDLIKQSDADLAKVFLMRSVP